MALFSQKLIEEATKVAPVVTPVAPVATNSVRDSFIRMSGEQLPSTSYTPPARMVRPFRAYQAAAHECLRAALERWGCAPLGDDMGLGKTQVMLAVIAETLAKLGGYGIVIAPPVANLGWFQDLAAAFPHLKMVWLKGRTVTTPEPADIYFFSDDTLTLKARLTVSVQRKNNKGKMVADFDANEFAAGASILVRDEIHRDKGNGGKPSTRSKIMLALGRSMRDQGKIVLGATGTLTTNRSVDAFLPLQIIGGDDLVKRITPGAKSIGTFLFRYCGPEESYDGHTFNGHTNEEKLHTELRANGYVRREKSDIPGNSLPHFGWMVVPVGLNGALDRYKRIEKEFLDMVLEEEGPESMWRKARAEVITRMTAMWQEAGIAKAKLAFEYITNLLDQDKKVICFYKHQGVCDALLAMFKEANIDVAIISGKVTGDRRNAGIRAFQSDDTTQVCVAQVDAAGMSVTLTAASEAVFVQVPWSAGNLAQCCGRNLRADDISELRASNGDRITYHVLQACHENGDPTFDAMMWRVLENKARVCDLINAGKQITMPDSSVQEATFTTWYADAMSRRAGQPVMS